MKKLILLAFFSVNFFDSYCQNNVFAIDSIPKEGILLNKGWKFHTGDNPDFAKADFDDSKWESIDPTQDVMDLKQFEKGNLGWFRLTFKVDSALFGQSFALSIKQTGSSQIYINGVLVKRIGEFSTKTISSKGYDPAGTPIRITFAKSEKQTFSIRFEKPNMFMVKRIELPNVCFFFKVIKVEEIINNYEYKSDVDIIELNFINVLSGIYFLVAFLHFWLYYSNKKSISNLIFSVVSILISILFFIYTFCFRPISIDIRNNLYILISTLNPIINLGHFIAINKLFSLKNNLRLNILIILTVISVAFLYINYDWGWMIGTLLMPFINSSQIITISWMVHKRGDFDAKAIGITEIIWVIFSVGQSFLSNVLKSNVFTLFFFHFINYTGFLFPTFGIIYYFARKFNHNSKNLQNKLLEVQLLSEEKQNTLFKQNAELQAALLQGQTTERKRVAADLHDNLGSTMSSIRWAFQAINKTKWSDNEKEIFTNVQMMFDKAYDDIRLLSHNLLPEEFERSGLTTTLQNFIRKINKNTAIQFDLKVEQEFGRVDKKIEFELYSICLELVNNIMKHSKATEAMINLSQTKNQIQLIVADNGIGIFNNDSDGQGMKNVQVRVDSLNGTWKIKNGANEGFVNEILIPI